MNVNCNQYYFLDAHNCYVVRLSSSFSCMLPFDYYIPSCTLTIVYSWIPYVLPHVKTNTKSRRPFNTMRAVRLHCTVADQSWRRLSTIPNIERMHSYCANRTNKVIFLRYRWLYCVSARHSLCNCFILLSILYGRHFYVSTRICIIC